MLSVSDFQDRTTELVAWLSRLVEIESPSTNKAAVDQLGRVIAQALRDLGAAVAEEPSQTTGNQIVGRWNSGSEPGILILCHTDTVHDIGELRRNPCREVNGRLYGPGTLDMKASIAMTLVACATLQAKHAWPARPITALFTSDEEIGSDTSRQLIETLARDSALVLCLEPCLADGSLKTWRKGVGDFEITARGKATHAGADHENGRNAIEEMAHHILAIQQLTDYSQGTTLNVGVVHGGTRSNVVPDEARIHVDMRVKTPAEADRITHWMFGLKPVMPGVSLEVTGGLNRPPMPHNEVMRATFRRAQDLAAQIGLTIGEGGTGGGSDANFVAPLGVPVLDGLGALGAGAHSEREHVVIASLPERTALLAALLSAW